MNPIPDEKTIAGLSCSSVLAVLSDYLDGDLTPDARARVEEHLRGCDGCARFGGEFQSTVRALREQLGATDRLPASVRERLRGALDDER
jgi:anti-sigma factor (TIGR02949 family)